MRVAFLKRDIPSVTEHPQAHAEIMNLLCIRQQYQEDMEEALVDGDDIRHDEAQQLNWECNERMHEIARKANGRDQIHPAPSSAKGTITTSASSGEKFVDVDDLPKSAYGQRSHVHDLSVMGQEQQGSLEV
jgi:hypothetical protein